MQQADDVVQDRHHRLAARLGVAVRDPHRDLLVLAEHHLRLVAAVVDERVVQAAVAGARVERRVRQLELLEQIHGRRSGSRSAARRPPGGRYRAGSGEEL